MNAQTCRLPGERELYPDEPYLRLRELGGPITLEAFRLIDSEQRSWRRDLPWAFTVGLLRRSKVRRINAGSNKLMFEAARYTLKTFEPSLHRMYADRGCFSYFPDERADALASELAAEAQGDPTVKEQVEAFLTYLRDDIAYGGVYSYMPEEILDISESEATEETFSRWIDFFEYVKQTNEYMIALELHRSIVCCARVHDAVFGSSILRSSRA
jgi:hypothetical protein